MRHSCCSPFAHFLALQTQKCRRCRPPELLANDLGGDLASKVVSRRALMRIAHTAHGAKTPSRSRLSAQLLVWPSSYGLAANILH